MLHHGGLWEEEVRPVRERTFVASMMQHTRDFVAGEMSLERCCITVTCGRNRLASEIMLHQQCNTLGFEA